jgi:hypothetical protein
MPGPAGQDVVLAVELIQALNLAPNLRRLRRHLGTANNQQPQTNSQG